MAHDPTAMGKPRPATSKRVSERRSFYVWTAIVLALSVTAVVFGWHAKGGTHRSHRPAARPSAQPHHRRHKQRHPRAARGSRDDPRARRRERQLPRRQSRLSPARRRRGRARDPRLHRHLVPRRLVHRPVPRRRVRRTGRDRAPLPDRPVDRHELVLPQECTGPAGSPITTSAGAACSPRTPTPTNARYALGLAPARLHLRLPRGLRGRHLPAEPARALRLERRARGGRHRLPSSPPPPASSRSGCTSGCPTGDC